MSKKSFKDSARASVASVFMSGGAAQEHTQELAQQEVQQVTQEDAHEVTQEVTQDVQATPQGGERRAVRTQGRKGKKSPGSTWRLTRTFTNLL